MPEDKNGGHVERPEDSASAQTSLPSWKSIVFGLWLAGTAAALSAILIAHYLDSRPFDLRTMTREKAADLERLLAYNQVPHSSITTVNEVERTDGTAQWSYREYIVDLPSTLSLGGVERLIRRTMAERNVSVVDEPDTPNDRVVLRLAADGKQFALLTLAGKPDRTNLTVATARLAQKALDVLGDLVPAVDRIERGPVEHQENSESIWDFARVDVWVSEPEQTTAILTAISAELKRNDVDVRMDSENGAEDATIAVSYAGLDCVHVTVHAPVLPEGPPSTTDNGAMADDETHEPPAHDVVDSEALPLDSEHLNGDARLPAPPVKQARPGEPLRVAIIVDDGGYGGEITDDVLELDPALTLSILPSAPHSTDTAQRAETLGFEVMLHMPMENSSKHKAYPGEITIAMPADKVHELTDQALADVPGAVGINNHTGSRYTSDPDAMRRFLEGIESSKLFFVDSRTISTSTAYQIAHEMGIPSAARDLFLDHESKKDYIRERFEQLTEICKKQGSAIAICHFRRNSVAVLREMLPEIKKEGIELVHASELVE